MQRRLGLALSFSALLIGGATLHRFAHAQNPAPYLAAANTLTEDGSSTSLTDVDFTDTGTAPDEKLTTTDLIGRQLFMDYLDLAQNGQATDANIQKLGDNYAANLTRIDTSVSYTPVALTTVPDSAPAFKTYAAAFSAIYNKYTKLAQINLAAAGDLSDAASPNFASAMGDMSILYSRAVKDLAAMQVPASLTDAHQRLIQVYTDNARALGVVSQMSTDPASAYAALGTQAKNTQSEQSIIAEMAGTLALNGASLSLTGQ